MDRTEAIERLRGAGFIAHERSWAMGKTIFVSHPLLVSKQPSGITTYGYIVWLRPDDDGITIVPPGEEELKVPFIEHAINFLNDRFSRILDPSNSHDAIDDTDNSSMSEAEETACKFLWALANMPQWGAPHPRAGRHVIRTVQELTEVWLSHGGKTAECPKVNFEGHMVLGIFQDAGKHRSTPCIDHLQPSGDGLLVFLGRYETSFDMTNPAIFVRVPACTGRVEFVDSAPEGTAT